MQCNECGIDDGAYEMAYETMERLELENETLKSLRDELFERIENLQASYEECFNSSNLLRTEHNRNLKDLILCKDRNAILREALERIARGDTICQSWRDTRLPQCDKIAKEALQWAGGGE